MHTSDVHTGLKMNIRTTEFGHNLLNFQYTTQLCKNKVLTPVRQTLKRRVRNQNQQWTCKEITERACLTGKKGQPGLLTYVSIYTDVVV